MGDTASEAVAGSRIGVLGGTFDPIHIGHLVAASEARWALDLDRVLLVVANAPWQKLGRRTITSADVRLAMVRAAVEGIDGLEASDLEIERGGETYTADTLHELRERSGASTDLFLIVGTDVAHDLESWKRVAEIQQLCTLAVVDRAGNEPDVGWLRDQGWRAERIEIPALEVSSSDIRRRVCEHRPIDFFMPPGAIRLLREHGLYADPG